MSDATTHKIYAQPLPAMDLQASNMALAWKNWHTKFKIYLKAYNPEKEADDRLVALLLHFMGQESLTIFCSFNVTIPRLF